VKKLVFFSKNQNKYLEIISFFKNTSLTIINLNNFSEIKSPIESGGTFEENAKIKSSYGLEKLNTPCFADDSGICIDALDSLPGIDSKKFIEKNDGIKNTFNLIISAVKKTFQFKAHFQTSICLSLTSEKHIIFNGIVSGKISLDPKGSYGFGYDPIFIPNGQKKTFAEMTKKEKNKISHRSVAIIKLKKYLDTLV